MGNGKTEQSLQQPVGLHTLMSGQKAEAQKSEVEGVSTAAAARGEAISSGLYKRGGPGRDEEREADGLPFRFSREELRLDVDGELPQMVASGSLYSGLATRVHWIANLTETSSDTYAGFIWFKEGNNTLLPHTNVEIRVNKSPFPAPRKAKVTFSGGGAPNRTRLYRWWSGFFRKAEFEYDTVEGTTAVTQIDTGAHPNRPATLPVGNLSIAEAYRQAGFDVTVSAGNNIVPIAGAGADQLWTDQEMHDAMQVYWSRFADKPQWALWALFAWQHAPVPSQGITPETLGGIMFDDIGPNHRQGTSIFSGSFISNAPAGDPSPAAWVERMKFWTACHEIGHAFNLAHSWQKDHPPSWGTPWIPLANEIEARSFMNYPYRVAGGESAFFADFEFRFSDAELLFTRHAPAQFVQMGNADWFDHHGFQQAAVAGASRFALEVRSHRTREDFEFLEPVQLELKLTNVSAQPQVVDASALATGSGLTTIIKRMGKAARQWAPYAQYVYQGDFRALQPAESIYAALPLGVGRNGWDIAEPGVYTVQVALHLEDEDVISMPFELRVAPPRDYEEERIAQDFFSDDVGRVLSFQGSRYLEHANDTLREVADRFNDRKVARHAQLALGAPLAYPYKLLVISDQRTTVADGGAPKVIEVLSPQPEAAREALSAALTEAPVAAADTLGHITYTDMVKSFGAILAEQGDPTAAADTLRTAEENLDARGVLPSVVQDVREQRRRYEQETPS